MNDTTPKQIFLSYSWANADIADAIDNDFKSVGITFQRDVRDVGYSGSIKEFMQRIGKSDFVAMIISDEYIRSENCMYEVTELLNSHEFEKKILPVIHSNSKIYQSHEQEVYYDYWQEKLKHYNSLLAKHTNEKTIADKKKIENICNYLGLFFQKITDLKSEKFEDLKAKDYKPILDKIGHNVNEYNIIEHIFAANKITDKEEREIAFEGLLEKYPNNENVLFYRASYASENKEYKKAKNYYTKFLYQYPKNDLAHNNYAILLENHFSEYDNARKHYELALEINPDNDVVHLNLATLLNYNLNERNLAKEHFDKAFELNPEYK